MADAVRHRGPDGEGFHSEPGLAFGHRRLAVVDLGGGAQPMSNEDGSVVVVYNGEIYNHIAVRRELEEAGHCFRTRSDTEVIIHGWEEWGAGCLDRLRGMFALALWDRGRGELLLARDRLGEKPLYYTKLPDGTVAFASELGALLAVPGISKKLDVAALDDFLALGYVPDPTTIYAGIRKLPPAHFLLLQRGDEGVTPKRYWRPPIITGNAPSDAPAELRNLLRVCVEDRLMSDVPLGAFLSGGMDSSAVTAFAAQSARSPLSTFTIRFHGDADEGPLADLVAQRFMTAHCTEMGANDYVAAARNQAGIFGEPFGDHSAVPTLSVCQLARRHVTVALSGDGGDEVLAGYRRYRWHMLAEAVRAYLPAQVRRRLMSGLAGIYPKLDRAPRWLRAKYTLTEISMESAIGYYRTVCRLHHDQRRALLSKSVRTSLNGYDPGTRFSRLMEECDPDEPLLQAQYADVHTYLPGDILTKMDRTSMAVSLEVRPPLLDHEFVTWGMALPARLKLNGGVGKQVLRTAMAPYLPSEILNRPKQGFADAIGHQLRAQAVLVKQRLLSDAMLGSGLFDGTAIGKLVEEHASGLVDHTQGIWQLLVLEGFLREGTEEMACPEASLICA